MPRCLWSSFVWVTCEYQSIGWYILWDSLSLTRGQKSKPFICHACHACHVCHTCHGDLRDILFRKSKYMSPMSQGSVEVIRESFVRQNKFVGQTKFTQALSVVPVTNVRFSEQNYDENYDWIFNASVLQQQNTELGGKMNFERQTMFRKCQIHFFKSRGGGSTYRFCSRNRRRRTRLAFSRGLLFWQLLLEIQTPQRIIGIFRCDSISWHLPPVSEWVSDFTFSDGYCLYLGFQTCIF